MTTYLLRGFVIGGTVLGLMAAGYLLTATGRSQTADASVSVTSATAPPGSQVSVNLVVTPGPGVTIGALGIVVTYDDALLSPLACFVSVGELKGCNTAFSPNQVAFAWVSVSGGISGTVGTLTFVTLGTVGVTNLAVGVTTCADDVGTYLTCTPVDGTVTVQQPTPSPTATPQPTPSPSPTPPPPTPSPTASPASRRWGDVNCSGVVDAVDALAILRKVAGLPVLQVAPCPTIGAVYP